MVAGGSLRAIEAILRGDVEHAFHPGGGLHHALAERASGFCIYNDPALAIAAAPPGRPAGPVRRPRCPSWRRRSGDPLRRSRSAHVLDPRERPDAVPGHGLRRGAGRGRRGRDVGQPAARGRDGRGPLAGRRPGARARPRGGLRAGPDRQPARGRQPRLGSARPPPGDDDGDGRGGPARRRGRPSPCRRPLARDRRRRLRRLPGRAPDLGPDLARRRPSRGARGDRSGAGAIAGRPRPLPIDQDPPPSSVRRRCRTPGCPSLELQGLAETRSLADDRPGPGALSCRGCSSSPRIGAGGIPWRPYRPRAAGRAASPRQPRRSSRSWTRASSIGSSSRRGPCRRPIPMPPGSSCSRPFVMAPGSREPLPATSSWASPGRCRPAARPAGRAARPGRGAGLSPARDRHGAPCRADRLRPTRRGARRRGRTRRRRTVAPCRPRGDRPAPARPLSGASSEVASSHGLQSPRVGHRPARPSDRHRG